MKWLSCAQDDQRHQNTLSGNLFTGNENERQTMMALLRLIWQENYLERIMLQFTLISIFIFGFIFFTWKKVCCAFDRRCYW